ncbi:hypothetical protein [Frateuria terrea]|uniref:Uncharacterized protein n=1 Tax=Frateuria terrea TaxID=529704 RepID=A0A1H6Q8G4_9GAMM|nr:hypothetical protein [Frateuria terrea]SEI40089.1 hypothetical protein SAMN04487997_0445 [Frateuria terrea]SFP05442.1 hypothetical protein SAMN02927913_0360 [Frateuria terrea]
MTEKLFEDYGITLFRRSDKFFVRYDAGHLVVQMREDEVTEEQAVQLQQDEQSAYHVLLEVERSRGSHAT